MTARDLYDKTQREAEIREDRRAHLARFRELTPLVIPPGYRLAEGMFGVGKTLVKISVQETQK